MTAAIFVTIMLSLSLATAELFSRFRDEPFLVIKSVSAWAYILLNIAIALGVLYLLTQTNLFGVTENKDWMKAAFMSGLGSTMLMRSKFLKISAGGKETVIGPEIIINVFLETLESRIDRRRALARKALVEACMADIDFDKASEYVLTTIDGARQTGTQESAKQMYDNVDKIRQSPMNPENKSHALGYLALDMMGEAFLKNLFTDRNRQRFCVESTGG